MGQQALTASQGQSSYHHVIPNPQQTGRHITRGVLGTNRHPDKRPHYKVPPAAHQNPSIPVLFLSVCHQILELSTSTSRPDQFCWGIQTEPGRHQHHLDNQPVFNLLFLSVNTGFRKSAMMTEDLSEYEGELSMNIFANFMHRRFMMAHIVQEAFIFTMVLSFLSQSWPFLGLWQFVSLCLGRWNSFKMSVDDSACLLMFSHDRLRGSTEGFRSFSR